MPRRGLERPRYITINALAQRRDTGENLSTCNPISVQLSTVVSHTLERREFSRLPGMPHAPGESPMTVSQSTNCLDAFKQRRPGTRYRLARLRDREHESANRAVARHLGHSRLDGRERTDSDLVPTQRARFVVVAFRDQ